MLLSRDGDGPGDLSVRAGNALWGDHDRPSVLELGPADVPGPAGRTASQRLDRLARPAVPHQRARRPALEAPGLGAAVLLLDDQDDEGVRTGEFEFLHDALELDRIFLVEHRKRMVRQDSAAGRNEGAAQQECSKSHDVPPFLSSDAGAMPRQRGEHERRRKSGVSSYTKSVTVERIITRERYNLCVTICSA